MSDSDGGSALDEMIECFLDFPFGFGIHRGSGFIQNEDARIGQQCPRDRDYVDVRPRRGIGLVLQLPES